jgi:bacterioferritin
MEEQDVDKIVVPANREGEVMEADVEVVQNQGLGLVVIAFARSVATKSHILQVSAVSIRPAQNVEQEWFGNKEYIMGTKGIEIVRIDLAELIADLQRAYADEWLAAYAYNYMGQIVTGRPAAKQLAELLLDTSKDELEHQQELADRIVSLGGKPVGDVSKLVESSNTGYPPLPSNEKDFEQIVKTVIKAEQDAIEVYDKLVQKTHGKDPITYALVTHILSEEVGHEDEFENLLR